MDKSIQTIGSLISKKKKVNISLLHSRKSAYHTGSAVHRIITHTRCHSS